MSVRAPNRVSDGTLSVEGGVDQGKAPNLLAPNCLASAVNTTVRGGWPYPRPGFVKRALVFPDDETETGFKQSLFQVAGGYVTDDGSGSLISMQGGRVYRIDLNGFTVQDITIDGDANPSNRPLAWCTQAENYFVIQDGQTAPYIYNGGTAFRLLEGKGIPIGNQVTYYMGRIWIAQGREYVAGDIVFGPSGSSSLGYRDSILYMTENKYLAEGGSFTVPAKSGEIVALLPIANINTVLGQGELIVFTQNNVFATLVPQDRTQWKDTTQPLQRMIQLANGAFSQDSVVNVNEDLFYRSNDGIRSLAYSVRNAGDWGNTPISNEVTKVLDADSQSFLPYCSGVNFDNRMLMTCSPGTVQGRGTYFRGLVALDFDLISGMKEKLPPAWDGLWTGLNYLKILTVMDNGVQRCFVYALSPSADIELWELTTNAQSDNNGEEEVRIQWAMESRAMDFNSKFDIKNLFSGDFFIDQVSGQVDLNVQYRPDGYPCWNDWDTWSECAKTELCAEDFVDCTTLPNFQQQYRPLHQFTQPQDTFDPKTKKLLRIGYEFQYRFNITGYCRVKQFRVNCQTFEQAPYGAQL